MNELSHESSPYLLQHASNPVHWKAWNPKNLALAKNNNRLLLVSIGYSACHWCHVMEHESFEDSEVASVMNAHFVSIKVDREERPDVDAVYMKAVQLMTGRGGWPLNCVCLPDGRPVWGGTYFRKNDWTNTLIQLEELYRQQPEKMVAYAENLALGMAGMNVIKNENPGEAIALATLNPLVEKWQKDFDWEFGGSTGAPKFMLPSNCLFLLRYGYQTQNQKLLSYVDLTLTRMAQGGIFDTVGGGFSRYAVDEKWHVPHFEKMLYDNGQLLSLYANAYKLTQNPLYREIIEKTAAFIEREWATPAGSYYAALDADSMDANQHLEEGAFYVWKQETLEQLLGDDYNLFGQVFNINPTGHWEDGNYVLFQTKSLETLAAQNGLLLSELWEKKKNWEYLLFAEREKRPKPRLDTKGVTSWNALLLTGFVETYKALGAPEYLERALRNGHFILRNLWSPEGNLWHIYTDGKAAIHGYLEDYCFVIRAFIALYQVTLDESWLGHSKKLTDYVMDHFYDETREFFRFTSDSEDALVVPHFETEDHVIPASNSVMAANLHALSIYFENGFYETTALKMLHHIIPVINFPAAYSNWLSVYMDFCSENKELALCGPATSESLKRIHELYLPNVVIAGTEVPSDLPFLQNRFVAGETLFYVCTHRTCTLPKNNLTEVIRELKH